VICRGEGEEAFRKMIQSVKKSIDYKIIEKLWVRDGGRIIKNPIGSLIKNLDSIPFPDRQLISLGTDSGKQIFGNSRTVMFSRGCPNRCSYCFNAAWNKLFQGCRIIRYRTVDNIIQEIKDLVRNFKLDMIYFQDDNLSLIPRDILREFCQIYKDEIGLPFLAQFRPELVDEELVMMLKQAGMELATVGVECGDETVSRDILHRGMVTNRDIIRAFDIFNKYKVKNFSQNLSALPVPNPLAVDLKTIQLNIRCKPTWSSFALLIPFPKTKIWEYAVTRGFMGEHDYQSMKRFPSVFTRTRLHYSNHSIRAQVNNLHKFSSIAVKFPCLLPIIKVIIRFPPNPLYQYIHFLWYGYWNTIGLFNIKFSFKLIITGLKNIRHYLKKH